MIDRRVFSGFAKEIENRLKKDEADPDDRLAENRRPGLHKLTAAEKPQRADYARPSLDPTSAT